MRKYLDKYHPKHHGHGKMQALVQTAEYAGLSYAYGYVQNRYRERASMFGVPADLLSGAVFKAASVFGGRFLGGGHLRSLVDTAGNAGIGAFFHTLGAGAGGAASGLKRVVVPAGDVDKVKRLVPSATILGDIPRASEGRWLSRKELADLSR